MDHQKALRDRRTRAESEATKMLTVEQAAERLGTLHTSGVRFPRRLIAERRIRFVRIGRHVRIPADAIDEYIRSNTVEPVTIRGRVA